MNSEQPKKGFFKKFPPQFWLVVMFEFFERGSYYGMMSFISVYFTDTLNIPKESVGVIKGVIQPLLYFLPIIAGAIADRFGYRRVLMVAFALLGGGYFLTSQMTSYTAVFAALVIMGFGAGTFKPIISGTIAKVTDESNSTQAFGIFYWSINLGAFLFPLVLVPFLKAINPSYVIIASAICTAAMLIPTALFFKEPTKQKEVDEKTEKRKKDNLVQTVANSFEIIYSPIVLIYNMMKRSGAGKIIIGLLIVGLLAFSGYQYVDIQPVEKGFPSIGIDGNGKTLIFRVDRNMFSPDDFKLKAREETPSIVDLKIYKPAKLDGYASTLLAELNKIEGFENVTVEQIGEYIKQSDDKVKLLFELNGKLDNDYKYEKIGDIHKVYLKDIDAYAGCKEDLLKTLHQDPALKGITVKNIDKIVEDLEGRSFFIFFVVSLIGLGLLVVATSMIAAKKKNADTASGQGGGGFQWSWVIVFLAIAAVWLLPGLTTLGRILSTVIYFSITSLFVIDKSDPLKFIDHAKFLLMIVLYSIFWILYFQMFDSVLWYVKAYVDAASLNSAVNGFLGIFGIEMNWFFDVEHVTVINAGTIIILQLVISNIVKNKKAMPTLLTGIGVATIGMAMLAVSTDIWVFMIGIVLFSIGEMTAHPKFISYIGLIAPSDKKAMYMGYLFLYGVFGSSIGGIVGAKLYVHFVDNLNQPRVLWLIFSGIGVFGIISLVLYNKFLAPKQSEH